MWERRREGWFGRPKEKGEASEDRGGLVWLSCAVREEGGRQAAGEGFAWEDKRALVSGSPTWLCSCSVRKGSLGHTQQADSCCHTSVAVPPGVLLGPLLPWAAGDTASPVTTFMGLAQWLGAPQAPPREVVQA